MVKIDKEVLEKTLVIVVDKDDNISKEAVITLAEMPYKQYLSTDYWKLVRKTIFETIERKCEVCGGAHDINIHHFNYECRGKERLADLVCLCKSCHFALHRESGGLSDIFIGSREALQKIINTANKIRKVLDNSIYIKLLALTTYPFWSIEQAMELWSATKKETEEFVKLWIKKGLLSEFSINNESFFSLRRFVWYLLGRDFPKIKR